MSDLKHLSGLFIRNGHASMLYDHFIAELQKTGPITIQPHKTMISIMNKHKRVAYVTQVGKNFIHIVFPFQQRYDDNFCFQKIQEVSGRRVVYHHFRMLNMEDINDEVHKFMRMAMNI
jgi:hypothetical protein